MSDTLYQCPECGYQLRLDHLDWQETFPACPVVVEPALGYVIGVECIDDMTASCPDAEMVPIWGPGAT